MDVIKRLCASVLSTIMYAWIVVLFMGSVVSTTSSENIVTQIASSDSSIQNNTILALSINQEDIEYDWFLEGAPLYGVTTSSITDITSGPVELLTVAQLNSGYNDQLRYDEKIACGSCGSTLIEGVYELYDPSKDRQRLYAIPYFARIEQYITA